MEWRQRQCGAGEGEASVHMELGDGLAGEGGRRFFMHRELKRGHSRWGGGQPGQGSRGGTKCDPGRGETGAEGDRPAEVGEEKPGRVRLTRGGLLWVSPQGRRKTLLLLMCREG